MHENDAILLPHARGELSHERLPAGRDLNQGAEANLPTSSTSPRTTRTAGARRAARTARRPTRRTWRARNPKF
eukprot:9479915-Pyramimonas_sp.AAC.1